MGAQVPSSPETQSLNLVASIPWVAGFAFLAGADPAWLWAGALLLAGLRATDKWLQLALGISPNAIFVIEAVLLLTVACRTALAAGLERGCGRIAARLRSAGGGSS